MEAHAFIRGEDVTVMLIKKGYLCMLAVGTSVAHCYALDVALFMF